MENDSKNAKYISRPVSLSGYVLPLYWTAFSIETQMKCEDSSTALGYHIKHVTYVILSNLNIGHFI